jgi:hypothetical protein
LVWFITYQVFNRSIAYRDKKVVIVNDVRFRAPLRYTGDDTNCFHFRIGIRENILDQRYNRCASGSFQ